MLKFRHIATRACPAQVTAHGGAAIFRILAGQLFKFGATFDALVEQLAPHGRLVVGGAAQDLDGQPEIVTGPRIVHKLYYKCASVRGFMNGLLTPHWPAARAALFPLYEQGRLQVCFDAAELQGLARVPDAIDHLLSGRSMGKVVVQLAEEAAA